MIRLSFIAFLFPLILWGQNDTVQPIQEVIATETVYIPRANNSILTKTDIEELSANDVGELIQKIAGVNLKSYGSLGGLKTVSMRGLGANHSSIVKDGFSLNNSQTGQVNLGQIEVDNVVGVISSVGRRIKNSLPVSAQISGSNFLIKTFENTFTTDTLQIRSNIKYGSFNQQLGYLGMKYSPRKFMFSAIEGENALLYPPADIGALVAAITRLANDSELRARFSQASIQLADSHDKSKMARDIIQLCQLN